MTKKTKTLKQLIKEFDANKPEFAEILPFLTGELEENLEGIMGNYIGKWNAIKTMWELNQPKKPKSRSRMWKSTNGYIFLVPWSNSSLLRVLGIKLFDDLKSPNSPLTSSKGFPYINRLEAQLLDSLRSVIANIEEGFARPTTSEYLQFLGYSQASLKEAKGDVQRMMQDGVLASIPGSSLTKIRINLKAWHEALKKSLVSKPISSSPPAAPKRSSGGRSKSPLKSSKTKGNNWNLRETKGKHFHKVPYNPLNSFKFGFGPVDNLDPKSLTYEIFIELINKTDFLLRSLVESLEKKLNNESLGYKVEKARIEYKFKNK